MLNGKSAKLDSALDQPMKVQKEAVTEVFTDCTGMIPRALRGMQDCTDFYFERISQIKLRKWYRDRCVLVGDAAYCPSPLTGQGTDLAVVGSYIMARELAANPDDLGAAFGTYDGRLRALVGRSQVGCPAQADWQ